MFFVSRIILLLFFGFLWAGCLQVENPKKTEKLQLYFFDVGQGDASCFWVKISKVSCVDVGPDSSKFVQKLKILGISKISNLFLSHGDWDHVGGINRLFSELEVENVYFSSYFDTTILPETLTKTQIELGDHLSFENFKIQVLWPPSHLPNYFAEKTPNNKSLALKLKFQQFSVLFPGDIEQNAEEAILATGQSISSHILKAPHHGSASSSYPAFVQAVNPIWVVFSSDSTVYGHPHKDVIDRYLNFGISKDHLLRTDKQGDLKLLVGSEGIRFY